MNKKAGGRARKNASSKDLRADMWIAPDIRRIIVGDKDDRYAVSDQFPGANNRMLDLADLALGSRPPSKKRNDLPMVEKEQIFTAATTEHLEAKLHDAPATVVEKTRTRG